jgi:hypothetical protein
VSGKDILTLVGFGLLSLYGLLVWRAAWTGEMPKTLQGAERGWRLRLALGLSEAAPNRRFVPALILWVWVGFLFLAAAAAGHGAGLLLHRIAQILGVCWLVMLLTAGVVAMLNRPKFLIPPYARDEPGILVRWMGADKTR